MNLILWTIPDLLVISQIPSETPNNIRSLSHNTITTQNNVESLSVSPYGS